MHLFTRSRRMQPATVTEALQLTVQITEHVRSVTGTEVNAWGTVLSPALGTVVWSLWVERLADLIAANDALLADARYLQLVRDADSCFEGQVADGLAVLVHGAPDLGAEPPEYVAVASAVGAPGRLGDAVTGGIEIAELATKLSGQPTMFVVNSTGPYGGVAWITAEAGIDGVQDGEAALMGAPEWVALIDRAGTAYLPGAEQTLYRRIV